MGFGFGGVVGGLYVHTLVKNLLFKFLMMLFLVAKGCEFDSCVIALIACDFEYSSVNISPAQNCTIYGSVATTGQTSITFLVPIRIKKKY